ncbi:antibiotic biosynthesis monooxygenase [Litorimonas sp.]|uniref:antibiotic biosynthesis monooxygenase n=1 Tax=Litorimonas sp. TaxID=1892381 RepID=UPI003A8360B9
MIIRYWRGWTTPENAPIYQKLLTEDIIPEIESRNIDGLLHIRMMRRDTTETENEVEFATLMTFDDLESVKNFMGEDYAQSHIPDSARAVLKRWDKQTAQYELFGDKPQ